MTADQERAAIVQPRFGFHPDAFRPETTTMGREPDGAYMKFHFDLCQAINTTRLAIILEKMVKAGWIDQRMAELLYQQASTLRALILSENNRAFRDHHKDQGHG